MAVEVHGTMIRIPQGDTGNVKFVADGALSEIDKALFTIARRDGSAVLRKVLSVDASDKAFHLPFAYGETARMRPDSYEWSLRVVRGGKLDAAASLDDKTASEGASLFPRLKYDGSLIKAGTRINWNGTIMKAAVDLWDTADNSPEAAPTLWTGISYKHGVRIIPNTITVTEAFAKGERGWWHDEVYESQIDANVYTPEQYPAGWALA